MNLFGQPEKVINPPYFVKPGYIKGTEALDRILNWNNIFPILKYYNVEAVFTQIMNKEKALAIEQMLLQRYPQFSYDLGFNYEDLPKPLGGFTEMRFLDIAVLNPLIQMLYGFKKDIWKNVQKEAFDEKSVYKFYLLKFHRRDLPMPANVDVDGTTVLTLEKLTPEQRAHLETLITL